MDTGLAGIGRARHGRLARHRRRGRRGCFAAEGARVVVHYRSGRDEAEALAAGCPTPIALGADVTSRGRGRRAVRRGGRALRPHRHAASRTPASGPSGRPGGRDDAGAVRAHDRRRPRRASSSPRARSCASVARQGSGSLVLVGSTAGLVGEEGHADYAAAKCGRHGRSPARASRTRSCGWRRTARVNAVAPGWTATEMAAEALDVPGAVDRATRTMALRKVATPDDVASQIVVLASDRAVRPRHRARSCGRGRHGGPAAPSAEAGAAPCRRGDAADGSARAAALRRGRPRRLRRDVAEPEVCRYLGHDAPDRDDAWRQLAALPRPRALRGYSSRRRWSSGRPARSSAGPGCGSPEGWPGLEVGWVLAPSGLGAAATPRRRRRAWRDYAFAELGATELGLADRTATTSLGPRRRADRPPPAGGPRHSAASPACSYGQSRDAGAGRPLGYPVRRRDRRATPVRTSAPSGRTSGASRAGWRSSWRRSTRGPSSASCRPTRSAAIRERRTRRRRARAGDRAAHAPRRHRLHGVDRRAGRRARRAGSTTA